MSRPDSSIVDGPRDAGAIALSVVIAEDLTEVDSVAFTETAEEAGRAVCFVETVEGERFRITVEREGPKG